MAIWLVVVMSLFVLGLVWAMINGPQFQKPVPSYSPPSVYVSTGPGSRVPPLPPTSRGFPGTFRNPPQPPTDPNFPNWPPNQPGIGKGYTEPDIPRRGHDSGRISEPLSAAWRSGPNISPQSRVLPAGRGTDRRYRNVMLLNAYAILDSLVAPAIVRRAPRPRVAGRLASLVPPDLAEDRTPLEERNYLLSLLALLLLGLNLASWPLLYLLLQSYVPDWPGVMCIYGVTRVGAGSTASSIPPALLTALQGISPCWCSSAGPGS